MSKKDKTVIIGIDFEMENSMHVAITKAEYMEDAFEAIKKEIIRTAKLDIDKFLDSLDFTYWVEKDAKLV